MSTTLQDINNWNKMDKTLVLMELQRKGPWSYDGYYGSHVCKYCGAHKQANLKNQTHSQWCVWPSISHMEW